MKRFSIRRPVRRIVAVLIFFLSGMFLYAQQDITGTWHGVLTVQGVKLRLVFHIRQDSTGRYSSTMDSPDQGAAGIVADVTDFEGAALSIVIQRIGLTYKGELRTDSVVGTFGQNGFSLPMTLKRSQAEAQSLARPQEPKPPYPYRTEDITFENTAAGITLSGTLTTPVRGTNFPAVVLITGSGAQNRNEEIMGHKLFLVLADYLTRCGIAVLRFDDRGTASSTGSFALATTADFAGDVESALAWLRTRKEVNPRKTGLVGHSEGGVIAPMVAARSKDVGFIVLLAGTAVPGDSIILLQQQLISRASGFPEEDIKAARRINKTVFATAMKEYDNTEQLKESLERTLRQLVSEIPDPQAKAAYGDAFIRSSVETMSSPWMRYFLRYDPAPALEKVRCPVLAVNGTKDLQVPADVNLPAIRRALEKGGNKKVTVKEYPGLNHLFQECSTGLPTEYASIEQTFSPEVMKDVAEWILRN